MKFKNIDLFIFDMDGLIFETEKLYLKFLPEVMKQLGYTPDINTINQTIGMNLSSMKQLYENKYGKDFPFATLSEKVYEKLIDHNEKYGLELVPGVLDVLNYLHDKGKKCVIASSSGIDIIKKYIKKNNLEKYFCDYTAGNEITHGKPNPEIFLLAARKQNVNPNNCIVFEDSYNGIRAGVNANMHTIMIPNVQKANAEMENISSLILKNIKEILMYI